MSEIERKMASIQRIADIGPIEGADAIEVATINGWHVVVKKGEFSVGDLVVYCEIDSFIPNSIAPFLTKAGHFPKEYNGISGERLRTVRLRGQLSQGLILPMICLITTDGYGVPEGTDVSAHLGIVKYEPPLPAQLQGQARGNFPSFIRKTDEERCQNLGRDIVRSHLNGDEYEITIKLDGSSMTVYHRDGEVGVCSRNLELKLDDENAGNSFIRAATSTGLLSSLKTFGKNIAVQGELMGEGIQGNRENLKGQQFFVFNIFDIDKQEYLTPMGRHYMFSQLEELGFTGKHVPVIQAAGPLPSGYIEDLLKFAEGNSLNHKIREGVVFKKTDGTFSFKAISNEFLLKEK